MLSSQSKPVITVVESPNALHILCYYLGTSNLRTKYKVNGEYPYGHSLLQNKVRATLIRVFKKPLQRFLSFFRGLINTRVLEQGCGVPTVGCETDKNFLENI